MMDNLVQSFTFKLMVIGDPAVGKTSLIRQCVENKFDDDYSATLGVEFMVKRTMANGFDVRLILWDVAGQSKYATFKRHYYDGASFVIIVFDVTNPKSCENVKLWLKDVHQILGRSTPFAILANKIDVIRPHISYYRPIFEIGGSNPNSYWGLTETSAKTSENVNWVFNDIAAFLTQKIDC